MSNVLTLKRSIIGDSSYVPSLKLYDKAGGAVDVSTLHDDTKKKIELVAQRMFRNLEKQAKEKTVTTLSERGLKVEGGSTEVCSLEDANIDNEWDTILALLAGDIGDNMSGPVESLLNRTTPERVLELRKSLQTNSITPKIERILGKFPIKNPRATRAWQMEAFIQLWMKFHKKEKTGFAETYEELVREYDLAHRKT